MIPVPLATTVNSVTSLLRNCKFFLRKEKNNLLNLFNKRLKLLIK